MKIPEDYIKEIQAASDAEYARQNYTLPAPTFSMERGSKYIRIISTFLGSKSSHCFLDAQGNIYKCASWKAPAKGIRGNINNDKKPLLLHEFYKYK